MPRRTVACSPGSGSPFDHRRDSGAGQEALVESATRPPMSEAVHKDSITPELEGKEPPIHNARHDVLLRGAVVGVGVCVVADMAPLTSQQTAHEEDPDPCRQAQI